MPMPVSDTAMCSHCPSTEQRMVHLATGRVNFTAFARTFPMHLVQAASDRRRSPEALPRGRR